MEVIVFQEPVKVGYECEHCGCKHSVNYKEFIEDYDHIHDLEGFEVECECCGEVNIISDIFWD